MFYVSLSLSPHLSLTHTLSLFFSLTQDVNGGDGAPISVEMEM